MPIQKIRVMKLHSGGGFGSKSRITESAALSAFLARKSRRPVRILYQREENFFCTRSRHPMIIHLKTGAKKDGTLLALEGKTVVEDGAYNDVGQAVAALTGFGLVFKIPNIREEGFAVYTNNPYSGRFRAFHGPAMMFALDSHLDTVARKMGMDPADLRLKNAVETGDRSYMPDQGLTSCGLRECIQKVVEASDWHKKKKRRSLPNRGVGMSLLIHATGTKEEVSSAFVKISDDRVTVISGAAEIGGGQDTILTQIASEELGIPVEDVKIVSMDTDYTPIDLGSRASRFTFYGGNAVRMAAADAKEQLLTRAAEKLEARMEDLQMVEGMISVKGSPDKKIHYLDVAVGGTAKVGKAILGRGHYDRPTGEAACAFAAQVAEVEVDPKTGQVKVLKFWAAHDLGRAINPMFAEGQIEGGIAQGIGFALTEHLVRHKGETLNPNFRDYKLPTALDVPPIETILVESNDPNGPFGAKAAGEPTSNPTPGAIANAVCDAVGIRIKSLPITPEKVLRALKEKERLHLEVYNEPDRPLQEWWPKDLEKPV
jgi:CO/xanthine dehydrogenase Mo-binding subunit